MRTFRVIVFILIASVSVFMQARKDVVVMKNGDRFTCEIVKLANGILDVKLDYAEDTISIQWAQVSRVESTRLFIVKTEGGSAHTGTISTTATGPDKPITIDVAEAPDANVRLTSDDVVSIATTEDKFWKRLNGDISIGVTYAKANQLGQYNLDSSIEYPRERWGARATFQSNLSFSDGSRTSSRQNLGVRANHMLPWKNYYYMGEVGLLKSTEQGISLQTNFGGGIGYFIRNTNRFRLKVAGGISLQRTSYDGFIGGSLPSRTAVAGLVTTEMRFAKFKKTSLNLEASLLPFITDPGRYCFRLNQKYYVKLFRDISWNISFYGDWDNKPPVGLPGSDYGASIGLGWTFGNR